MTLKWCFVLFNISMKLKMTHCCFKIGHVQLWFSTGGSGSKSRQKPKKRPPLGSLLFSAEQRKSAVSAHFATVELVPETGGTSSVLFGGKGLWLNSTPFKSNIDVKLAVIGFF